ncbi:Mismatch repair endonuclease pms2 [Entomortierella beljakovae]|nr:Mismatch repair endonuclease pms2 [Entomortierella beljakovae]
MATAVKELLENSLDAGATSISIKFKQNGLESITVTDNGCGITDANLETLALKHYTSKLSSFNDLAQVRSFGFRGEALSSLCALSILMVTTSTGSTPTGVLVEYTSDGTIKSKTPAPMTKGTIVQISNLFEGMPVRRSEFVKNVKREYAKCIGLIQAYALIVPNVRISCLSQADKKPAQTQIATSGNASVRQNIINVFGPKGMTDIIDFELCLVEGTEGKTGKSNNSADENDADDNEENSKDNKQHEDDEDEHSQKQDIIITGYISSPAFGKGRSSTDRQYIYINGRPCTLPKVSRVINEVYRSFNTNQSPFLVANLILPTYYYDVNVSPDKRTIFLHNERVIVEELRTKLTELFEPSRSTFAVSEARQLIKKPDLSSRLTSVPAPVVYDIETSEETRREMNGNDDGGEGSGDEELESQANTSIASISESVKMSSLSITRNSSKPTHNTPVKLTQSTLMDRFRSSGASKNEGKRKAEKMDSESEEDQLLDDDDSAVVSTARPRVEEITLKSISNIKKTAAKIPAKDQDSFSPETILTEGKIVMMDDIMEGYDPLDDRIQEEKALPSDSSDDDFEEPTYQLSVRQRVVVLDTETQSDGDRDWVEIGFEIEEQKRRRACRMEYVKRGQLLEKELARKRKERSKQGRAAENDIQEQSHEAEDTENNERDDSPKGGVRRSRRLRSDNLSDASFANMDDAKAQKSLSRVISKEDFGEMKILGQFNNAFIVTRLDKYTRLENSGGKKNGKVLVSSDIFVVDQHASDEKYNFETLQEKTVFSTQRLFRPKNLYLTAQEEITVVEHMKMLNKNGFYLDYDPEAPVSHRLKLVTLPVSEKVIFDLQDFEELVFLLSQQTTLPENGHDDNNDSDDISGQEKNGETGHRHRHLLHGKGNTKETMVRCSKVRSLFASRACRRSVMIGKVLNHGQMKRIVRHMGEIDQPWNCPHGRPTMRHLLDLAELEQQQKTKLDKSQHDDDNDDNRLDSEDLDLIQLKGERAAAFDPIALKRPTRHQGSLFRQFMAIPPQ